MRPQLMMLSRVAFFCHVHRVSVGVRFLQGFFFAVDGTVLPKTGIPRERLVANFAPEGLFSGVYPHVDLEAAVCMEVNPTDGTLESLGLSVSDHVAPVGPQVAEYFATDVARHLPSFVDRLVHLELILDGEFLIARRTLVRLLSRVYSHMSFQVASLRELSAAEVAAQ